MKIHAPFTRALGVVLLIGVPACAAVLGVDLDVHPRPSVLPDSPTPTEGGGPESPDASPVPPPVHPDTMGRCDEGRKNCDGLCVSPLDPNYGCATVSCAPCSISHGAAICSEGACGVGACDARRANCNDNATDGCETNTDTSPKDCGACGAACSPGQVCSGGACAVSCVGGKVACNGACVDLSSDPDHCASCEKACDSVPNGVATCASATCGVACNAGYRSCGGTCRADSATSCGLACAVCSAPAHGLAVCKAGACTFTCAPGYIPTGAACIPDAGGPGKLVFVTSQVYTGNLGGLVGGDAKCQARASAAGLAGTFKAWLSTETQSASDRLTHSTIPYRLVNGTLVAADWAGLTSGTLVHGIDKTEAGNPPPSVVSCGSVWTATQPWGSWSGFNCADWSSETGPDKVGALGNGTMGVAGATDGWWTRKCTTGGGGCQSVGALYCFEQ